MYFTTLHNMCLQLQQCYKDLFFFAIFVKKIVVYKRVFIFNFGKCIFYFGPGVVPIYVNLNFVYQPKIT